VRIVDALGGFVYSHYWIRAIGFDKRDNPPLSGREQRSRSPLLLDDFLSLPLTDYSHLDRRTGVRSMKRGCPKKNQRNWSVFF
jgi:hypothetical protein